MRGAFPAYVDDVRFVPFVKLKVGFLNVNFLTKKHVLIQIKIRKEISWQLIIWLQSKSRQAKSQHKNLIRIKFDCNQNLGLKISD